MRYLFFCAYGVFPARRFSSAAFFRTRAYVHVGICAHAHTCAMHAHLLLAREERNFSCRRFMILLRSFFIRRASKKQNCGIFGGNQCGTIQNSGKKREIRLETAEKRLFAAMKWRYSSEKTVKQHKPAKKREKRKKTKKKLKNFKKVRKNSWQGGYKCGIIVKLTNERTSTAGRTPVKQAD